MTKKTYCYACNKEITDDTQPCECGCMVFTCPSLDVGFRYCWDRFTNNPVETKEKN